MTLFDAIAGGILVVSALVGLARGATREVITLVSLALSLALALFATRFTEPLAAHVLHIRWMATAAAILAVFVLAYILFRIVGSALVAGVRGGGLSGLDRALGLALGLGRGLLVVGAAALLIGAAIPAEHMPGWISRAKLYPLAEDAGAMIKAAAPSGFRITHEFAPIFVQSATSAFAVSDPRRQSLAVVVEAPQ